MSRQPSAAERLDRAVDGVLDGQSVPAAAAAAGLDPSARDLLRMAADLRAALHVPLASPHFEARLGTRLAPTASRDAMAWALRHPRRLIVTGAVGSAVGVGVTAFAFWRNSRRAPSAHRLLHR